MISVHKSNFKNYEKLHHDAVIRYCERRGNRKFIKNRMDQNILYYFGGIINNLSELISASPEKLFELKVYFDSLSQPVKDNVIVYLDYEGLYDIFINKNSLLVDDQNNRYNSDVLSKLVDINTCPYCNENTTYSFWHAKQNHLRRTFDWDHIIPKGSYPFLAISFYNLVPACKVCNHLKLEKDINLSPHSNFNPNNTYTFQVSGESLDFIKDSKSLNLLIKLKKGSSGIAMKGVIDVVSLDTRLDTQKELMMDILNKKRIYNSSYWDSIEKLVAVDDNQHLIDLKRLFFSTYFNPDDYFRRPFSKLTHDLLIN